MKQPVTIIGRAECVEFPELEFVDVAARIDTGAKTSSIWASSIEEKNGTLSFSLFGPSSKHFTNTRMKVDTFERRIVANSNGYTEERYVVKLLVCLSGRKIRASFTLANRSRQAYPVLVGRNVLRGKFIVDVTLGQPLIEEEHRRSRQLQSKLPKAKEQS